MQTFYSCITFILTIITCSLVALLIVSGVIAIVKSNNNYQKASIACYPNVRINHFERNNELFAICATDGKEYIIKKADK